MLITKLRKVYCWVKKIEIGDYLAKLQPRTWLSRVLSSCLAVCWPGAQRATKTFLIGSNLTELWSWVCSPVFWPTVCIIIHLHSMQKWTVKYAMCRTEKLTVLALTDRSTVRCKERERPDWPPGQFRSSAELPQSSSSSQTYSLRIQRSVLGHLYRPDAVHATHDTASRQRNRTGILIIISFPSPTLPFSPDLKPSFSANPSHCSLSFSSSGLATEFPRLLLLILSISVFSFSVLHF